MGENEAPSGPSDHLPHEGRNGTKWLRVRETVPWSEDLAEAICTRVAGGELLYAICREAGMPTAQSVGRWARERPEFGEALQAARLMGGRPARDGGGVWTYSREVMEVICQRIAEGEALTAICREPEMPCHSTVFYWAKRFPEIAEMLRQAREAQAGWYCDRGWELAMEATSETAYLTDVRLKQLRWMAGCLAPRTYRPKMVEPKETKRVDVIFRHFKVERDPATGKDKVVAYCPNPETGELEREADPGWRPPENAWLVAGGVGRDED